MSTTIVLSRPENLNLEALASSAKDSLVVLRPWTHLNPQNDNTMAVEISNQAAKYVDAIQLGVSAAYSGFTVTEDVLCLADMINTSNVDPKDAQGYLLGMLDLARKARENSNKACEGFRDIRAEIFRLQEGLSMVSQLSDTSVRTEGEVASDRSVDQENLEALMKFANQISTFANWWDWIRIETDVTSDANQPVELQLDTLYDRSNIARWKDLRKQYAAYVQVMQGMQDGDPQFFKRSWVNNSSDATHPTPEEASTSDTLWGTEKSPGENLKSTLHDSFHGDDCPLGKPERDEIHGSSSPASISTKNPESTNVDSPGKAKATWNLTISLLKARLPDLVGRYSNFSPNVGSTGVRPVQEGVSRTNVRFKFLSIDTGKKIINGLKKAGYKTIVRPFKNGKAKTDVKPGIASHVSVSLPSAITRLKYSTAEQSSGK